MSIKQLGGVFGRNPTFNDVTIEGELTFDGDIDINSDLKIDGDLEVIGTSTLAGLSATTGGFSGNVIVGDYTSTDIRLSEIRTNKAIFSIFTDGATNGNGTTIGYSWANGGQGPLKFNNAAGEVARFTTNGNLAFVSGKGIDFSATAGTGTSELFDDYEEGAWTPTTASDATGAFASAEGVYTKVGRLVFIEMYAVISTNFTSNTIGGLPFPVADLISGTSFAQNSSLLTNAANTISGVAQETTSDIRLYNDHAATSAHNPDTTNLGYRLSLCYQA
jgi:hypothetical protein